MKHTGFGDERFTLAIYIANRPAVDVYSNLDHLRPLGCGEIQHIVSHTGNHWRKVFNVYAKFICQLKAARGGSTACWQDYRDCRLLQAGSGEALLFSPPQFERSDTLHIVAGKTYAAQLSLPPVEWLDSSFAINRKQRLIVSPYLDYRQLSNERIHLLVCEANTLMESSHGAITIANRL